MQLALEDLENAQGNYGEYWLDTITALRNALAQPEQEQEPVAWMFQHEETGRTMCVDAQQVEWGFEKGNPRFQKIGPLYTSPPKRQPLNNFERFNGVDIQFRRSGTDWVKPYRVQVLVNKNEREEMRTTVFCDTLDEAIEAAHGIGDEQ